LKPANKTGGGKNASQVFSDSRPWLDAYGDADPLPWAVVQFDKKRAP